uniref:Uncharacterized protein n=1 Tax=Anguilla anguilla TaxID=7936 RepID=A0A0E9TZJ6_ANGAN
MVSALTVIDSPFHCHSL